MKTEKWLEEIGFTPMLTVKEVAEFLKLHPKSVYRMINNKEFPLYFKNIGGVLRLRRDQLANFLDAETNIFLKKRKPGRPKKQSK